MRTLYAWMFVLSSAPVGLSSLVSVNWGSKGSEELARVLIQVKLRPSGVSHWKGLMENEERLIATEMITWHVGFES